MQTCADDQSVIVSVDLSLLLFLAAPGHKNELEFNSVQRAHQNTLESYAIVMLQVCVLLCVAACGDSLPSPLLHGRRWC